MAKGYDSSLVVWKTDGWFDTGTSSPFCPLLISEGLNRTHIRTERNSMVRDSRAMLPDSMVFEESKPEGFIEFTPRLDDLTPVLMSHFQMYTQTDTGSSYINTFVPSRTQPVFTTSDTYGSGNYGDEPGDAYSLDIWKKQRDPYAELDYISSNRETTQQFKRGICNTLDFSMAPNDDLKVKADFKFKEWDTAIIEDNPGDAGYGDYSTGSITDWRHGTWAVDMEIFDSDEPDGAPFGLSGINISCSNNLTERKIVGADSRQTFIFGDYTVKGDFSTEYFSETYQEMFGNTNGNSYFSITGTMFHSDTEYMVISMPHCIVKPHEYNLKKPTEFIDFTIPFEAYENNGTAPITVTMHTVSQGLNLGFTFYDAGTVARTISQYDFLDAGTVARTLSEYDYIDRDI